MESYKEGKVADLLVAQGVGAGAAIKLNHAYLNHSFQTTITGTPTAVDIRLEGSLDNVTYFELSKSIVFAPTGELRHRANAAVKYIRGNVVALTGGSSPKVNMKYLPSIK